MTNKEKEIKKLADRLGEITDPINEKLCSKCPDKHWGKCDNKNCNYCKTAGCCSDCGDYKGYLKWQDKLIGLTVFGLGLTNTMLKDMKLLRYYNKKSGFFDLKNKKCKLPRYKRSITCLSFTCGAMIKKLGKRKEREIIDICAKIDDLREKENGNK